MTLLAKFKSKASIATLAGCLAMLLIPTMGAAHINKGILKMTSRIPYWEHTIKDPLGVKTAQMLHDEKSLTLDKAIPEKLKPTTTIILSATLLTALIAMLLILFKSHTLKRYNMWTRMTLLSGGLIYWGLFAVMLYMWRLK